MDLVDLDLGHPKEGLGPNNLWSLIEVVQFMRGDGKVGARSLLHDLVTDEDELSLQITDEMNLRAASDVKNVAFSVSLCLALLGAVSVPGLSVHAVTISLCLRGDFIKRDGAEHEYLPWGHPGAVEKSSSDWVGMLMMMELPTAILMELSELDPECSSKMVCRESLSSIRWICTKFTTGAS